MYGVSIHQKGCMVLAFIKRMYGVSIHQKGCMVLAFIKKDVWCLVSIHQKANTATAAL